MTEQTTVGSPGNDSGATSDLSGHERAREQRELAARRGLSEGALVEAQMGAGAGVQVIRLRTDWPLTLHRLGAVGPVIALTGNRLATIETTVIYRNIATRGPAAQISDLQTDLCLFLSEWRTGFAVIEESPGDLNPRRSLQFFDARGTAVHRVLLPAGGDADAFDELVRRQASENQRPTTEGEAAESPDANPAASPNPGGGDDETLPMIHDIDIAPAHQFERPLWSRRVARESLGHVLATAIAAAMPMLVMVGNRGAVHNHAGPLHEMKRRDGWLTIRDPELNLHLDESGVDSAWVVRKATPEGVVASLELYDRGGEMILYLARL
jgi:putative hemin transport protein